MGQWRSSLDQRGRAALRVHLQWRNVTRDDQPCCDERGSGVGPDCRLHLPYPVYLDTKQALRRRAMGERLASIAAAVQNQAVYGLGHLSRSGGYRCFGASHRIPTTRRPDHPREQVSFDPQPGAERGDSYSRIRFECFGMAMRFPRRLFPLVLENKENPVGKDFRGLAGSNCFRRRPCGRVASHRERVAILSPTGGPSWYKLARGGSQLADHFVDGGGDRGGGMRCAGGFAKSAERGRGVGAIESVCFDLCCAGRWDFNVGGCGGGVAAGVSAAAGAG